MPHKYAPLAWALLETRCYAGVPRIDTRECKFVHGDDHGYLVDFHTDPLMNTANRSSAYLTLQIH